MDLTILGKRPLKSASSFCSFNRLRILHFSCKLDSCKRVDFKEKALRNSRTFIFTFVFLMPGRNNNTSTAKKTKKKEKGRQRYTRGQEAK